MGYMRFKEPLLENIFKNFKWARNNTILIFDEALKNDILLYVSSTTKPHTYVFQPLIFQFQCIITTTDTYFRKLTGSKNTSFGVLVQNEVVIPKKEITAEKINKLLKNQLIMLQQLFKSYDSKHIEENIESILALSNHEYLHRGQMIIDFREAGVELPLRYKKAWAL